MAAELKDVTERIDSLEQTIGRLEARITALEEGHIASPSVQDEALADHSKQPKQSLPERLLSLAGKTDALPRLATTCFILVVALALRTATDNEMLNQQLGTMIGMVYAAGLIMNGWYLYGRQGSQSPVFITWGTILFCMVVVETQAHFKALPPIPAYFILMAMGACLAIVSHLYKKGLPVIIGTIGMCLAGMAIDYPNPIFTYLAPLILFANGLAFFASHIRSCSWLRWFVLGVTILVAQVWSMKLGIYLIDDQVPPSLLAENFFFPVIGLFTFGFVLSSYYGVRRSGTDKLTRFDNAVPTVAAIWAYMSCHYVLSRGGESFFLLGLFGLLAAGLHYLLVFALYRRGIEGTPGAMTLTLAGTAWAALCMPQLLGGMVGGAMLLSLLAFGLILVSEHLENRGVRWSGYLLQVYSAVGLLSALYNEPQGKQLLLTVISTGVVALVGLYLFIWCRKRPVREGPRQFAGIDRKDRLAVLILFSGLLAGFFQARALLHWGLHQLPGNQLDAFICLQSVLINSAIAVFIVLAWRGKNREMRNIAVLVTLIAAAKVFMIDMLSAKGMPLVVSVLSFGLVASVESFVLTRWQKLEESDSSAGEEPVKVP